MNVQKQNRIVEQLKAIQKPGISYDTINKKYVDIMVSPTVILRDDKIIVSAEDGRDFADYYGEFRGGYPFVDPVLEKFAATNNMFWEWENPGCIYLCEK